MADKLGPGPSGILLRRIKVFWRPDLLEGCRVWDSGLIPRAVSREGFGMSWKPEGHFPREGEEAGAGMDEVPGR